MNTTTVGRCNVYYSSVYGIVDASIKFSVTFHSSHGIGFLSETGSSTAAIFENTTTYGGGGGRKIDVVLFFIGT